MFEERFYREFHQNENMSKIQVTVDESDVLVIIDPVDTHEKLKEIIHGEIKRLRRILNGYIKRVPEFESSLKPLEMQGDNEEIIQRMYKASALAHVGPMACVAGIVSELIAEFLLEKYIGLDNVLVENGGDIYLHSSINRKISIYAGQSPLSNQLSIQIKEKQMPIGICTSAGTVGHSLSFGQADAVVVISKDTALADGVATYIGNITILPADIENSLKTAMAIEGIEGVVIIVGETLGALGEIEFV